MAQREPVQDWATDFDHLSDDWAAHSPEILADLRERCPVAHTDRFFGAYLVTRYDDIHEVARNTSTFSSRITVINDNHPDDVKLELPPITLDPPHHTGIRRALNPSLSPKKIELLEPWVEQMTSALLDTLRGRELIDGAEEFAQIVPIEVTCKLLGVAKDMHAQFRQWVDAMLKDGLVELDIARKANREAQAYFAEQLQDRRENPADDLITTVLHAEVVTDDGSTRPFTERERIGALFVLMLGGIDTTWSSIGASLFHLATHPDDLEMLTADPELIPSAVEELLRFYSPVTIARVIKDDAEIGGCPVHAGERLMLSFPSANRDPDHFENPDTVILDRKNNRHLAFGVGIHRCIGSNLARMDMTVALRLWLERFPRFELAVDPDDIVWSIGAVRGPRNLPLRIL